MKNQYGIVMPHAYDVLSCEEGRAVAGGSAYGLVNFIAYLLGGFNVSFGSNANHRNTDTIRTTSQSGGRNSSTVHTNVDTIDRGEYGGWSANFNLGQMFRAIMFIFI